VERIRRTLAALALVAIAIGSFQPFYVRVWQQEWRALGAYLTELPYRKVPGMRQLLVEVDHRTPPGSRILFATPHRTWEGGYGYAFRRAQYLLAGKDVIPMIGPAREADFLVCWSRCTPPAGFTVIWKSDAGSLARRKPR
jgi:hypothetical protein